MTLISPANSGGPSTSSVSTVSPSTSVSIVTPGIHAADLNRNGKKNTKSSGGVTKTSPGNSPGAKNGANTVTTNSNNSSNGGGGGGQASSINPNMPKGTRFNEKTMLLSSDEEFQ